MSNLRTWWTLYRFTQDSILEQPSDSRDRAHTQYGCGCTVIEDRVLLCDFHRGVETGGDWQLIEEGQR